MANQAYMCMQCKAGALEPLWPGTCRKGTSGPTLEIMVAESPAHLCKVKDPESGLALISARK